MSADNGHLVCKTPSDRYGIFYYSGDDDNPPQWYTDEHAKEHYNTCLWAIVRAHQIEDKSPTEYGVHVHTDALNDAYKELQSLNMTRMQSAIKKV